MRIKQAKDKFHQPKKCLARGGGEVAGRFQEVSAARAMHGYWRRRPIIRHNGMESECIGLRE